MHFSVLVAGDDAEEQLAPFQQNNMGTCPQEYLEFFEDEDCEGVHPETGKKGYWENPNAEWDWYCLGGRYSGRLRLKVGLVSGDMSLQEGTTDSALKEEIDFECMEALARIEAAKEYDEFEKAL